MILRVSGLLFCLLFLTALAKAADAPAAAPPALRLWPGDAPGAQGTDDKDIPTITIFKPASDKSTGAAIVVCPGGGYGALAFHEGQPVAEWLNTLGITGVVLKYRLGPKYHHPVALGDVSRAIRTVRANAQQWKLDPKRVGVMGFSAGGHLASTAATHFDDGDASSSDPIERASSRPDLAILVYPVISMHEPYVHKGSRRNLLGDNPDPKLVDLLSNEMQVTPRTPPCFLVHTADDKGVPVQNSIEFTLACLKNKVPVELHVLEHGPHGFGLGGNDPVLSAWPQEAARWLQRHEFAGGSHQ
jgi:acetyl esterase/lipase